MKFFIKFGLAIIICFIASSCFEAVHFIALPKKPKPIKFQKCQHNNCKEVVVIPMVHLAKPKYYRESTKIITSLRKKNYSFFYERAIYPRNTDSLTLDTLKRKMRKLIGVPFGFKLTDTSFSDAYPNFFSSGRYIMQNPESAGYSYNLDKRVDLDVEEVLNMFEKKYGEIILSKCDFDTNFKDKYWCNKLDSEKKNHVIKDLRENFIIKKVEKSNEEKIGLIYGKIHTKGFEDRLLKLGFTKVKYND